MKECFEPKEFNETAMALIKKSDAVLTKYAAQGYDLTLRQLYYVFIAKDWFPAKWVDDEYNAKKKLPAGTKNTEKNYDKFGKLISDARVAGLLDWDAIKDRGRSTVGNTHWKDPAQMLEHAASGFWIDLWKHQPNYIEVMVEKQALEGILIPACSRLDVYFSANKGYASSSMFYEVGKRLARRVKDGKKVHVLYLGDHDPSGMDMTRDVEERLQLYGNCKVHVHRIALNMDQIQKLRAPPNPAKFTDSRAAKYIERFGESSWELDAIEPTQLAKLVRDAVRELRDEELWTKAKAVMLAMREDLKKFADDYRRTKA